jgi:hypothetical protein
MLAPCLAKALAMPKPMPLVEPVTNAVLPCNMMSTPKDEKDELGCSKVHYGAAKAQFELQRCQIVSDCHDCYTPFS